MAREKALLDADIRKKDEAALEKEISKEQNISKKTKAKNTSGQNYTKCNAN